MLFHLSHLFLQGKLIFVCSSKCSQEFKKANFVTSLCECCKREKITAEAKRINNKDCFFCSKGKETLQFMWMGSEFGSMIVFYWNLRHVDIEFGLHKHIPTLPKGSLKSDHAMIYRVDIRWLY